VVRRVFVHVCSMLIHRFNRFRGIEMVLPYESNRNEVSIRSIPIMVSWLNQLVSMTMENIFVEHRIPKVLVKMATRFPSKPKVRMFVYHRFFWMNTFVEAIKFNLQPKSIYHVNEREQLILPCIALGNPQPNIKWFKVRFLFPVRTIILNINHFIEFSWIV